MATISLLDFEGALTTSAKPTPYFECSKCIFELLRLTKTDPY